MRQAFLRICVLFLFLVLLCGPVCAYTVTESDSLRLDADFYLRTDFVNLADVVDLDSSNHQDHVFYLGIDYSLGLKLDLPQKDTTFYLKLERNGPYDYSAPVTVDRPLLTSDGVIAPYRRDELLPNLEEFWVDAPLARGVRIQTGLFSYAVGNGFALNGGYENYGVLLYAESAKAMLRAYYCRPDLVHKTRLGPRIPQEEEQGISYHPNATNFFALDLRAETPQGALNPYVGVLVDYTSPGKRANSFDAPIDEDILGTVGIAWNKTVGNARFSLELARNFGRGRSLDSEHSDVEHCGYLGYIDAQYTTGRLKPLARFLISSGNKVSLDDVASGATKLSGSKNRAFSYASPLNENPSDCISSSNADILPIVAMGTGYGLNYGIPRPTTFGASDYDNLLMPSLQLEVECTKRVTAGFTYYYLAAFQQGAGIVFGEPAYLPRELGNEIDVSLEYTPTKNIFVNILGGVLFPGAYYRLRRDDSAGSLVSPFVRGDGDADVAWQLELACEVAF